MDYIPSELHEKIQKYVEEHTSKEPSLLHQLNRETHLKVLKARMLSGHLQGRVLSMFSKMVRPKNILEIGTYTGYSAICLSEGLQPNGKLHTIDINEELENMVRNYFSQAEIDDKVHFHIGNALEIIPQLDLSFDLVFIDADKINYSNYYALTFDKVPVGGFIIIDNVLWSGKVIPEGRKKLDKDTKAIIDFNQQIQKDSRVENVLFPIRDGMMVLQKISE
ncbi:O-methyltransferase [Xanthovirga aplysinae]|uniref:O-methyltransferase n=1 Tax=Xanthovirga aplysinae TaxID=2529853 RepID=UPI0012BB8CFD|nr:O-methyltransferase [Xanthovirga aplysinae]MTI33426.1 O-methyltransferase [Xanthovirga aplysinae]